MEIVNHIKYDLAKRGVPPVIDAVQGENNARIIELSLFANGSAFDVSGAVCSLAFSKPDGTSGWYDTMPDGSSAYETNGNVLRMKIAPQVLTVHGNVTAVVRIESNEAVDRTTTFPLIISVSEDPAMNVLASANYYSVQNWDAVNQLLPYAILHIKQELSEAAKTQARKNINAVGKGEPIDLYGKRIFNSNGILFDNSGRIIPMDNGGFSFQDGFGNDVILTGIADGQEKNEAVNKRQLDAAVGDIETALDAIIAIQNELRGTISFNINDEAYTAIFGMNWSEWCNSEYNNIGAYVEEDGGIMCDYGKVYTDVLGNDPVQSTTVIVAGSEHYCM